MSNRIVSKEEVRAATEGMRTVEVAVPEIAEDGVFKVRGYTAGDVIEIQEKSNFAQPDGRLVYDRKNDYLYSFIRAVADPQFDLIDTEWILRLPVGVLDRVINAAQQLGGRGETDFEELKRMLKTNRYLRRIYAVASRLGKLPSDLAGKTELEITTMLAHWEIESEEVQAAMDEAE